MKKKRTGFTLIELLVVMAILGILATVGLTSFRTAQIKSRDVKRKHDLGQIQKALEFYFNDNTQYPLTAEFPAGGAPWQPGDTLYIKKVPQDPRYGDYVYESSDGTYYKLYARIENVNDPCFDSGVCQTYSENCGGENCNYMVSSGNVTP